MYVLCLLIIPHSYYFLFPLTEWGLSKRAGTYVSDRDLVGKEHGTRQEPQLMSLLRKLKPCPMSAYVSIRQHTPAYVGIRVASEAPVTSIRQHTPAYVGIRVASEAPVTSLLHTSCPIVYRYKNVGG